MANSIVEDRIWMIVGGKFTPDSIGPDAYERTVAAVRAEPAAHVAAFRALFLGRRPNARQLTDLHLTNFLTMLGPTERNAVRALARQLDGRMRALANANEAAEREAETTPRTDELARRQRRLAAHRYNLAKLI